MSASRPTGDSLKLAKKLALIAHRTAEETLHKEGYNGLQTAGALMEKVLAETASGKGAAKNAKRDAEEREAWERSCAVWRKAMMVHDAYTTRLITYTASGMRLPFRPPPPPPGPAPAPFVSSAERNRLENEAKAAANRAKMASMPSSSNSSCSPMPTIVHGGKAGELILQHQRELELAKIDKVAERARQNNKYNLARMGEKLLRWARSIRSFPSLSGTANRLQLAAFQLSNDMDLSITQRRKWSNILKFCVQCRSGKVELSLLGRAISTAASASVVSDTIHISNLPGSFYITEMVKSVLPQVRALITGSPVYKSWCNRVRGKHIIRNKIAMRDGWSNGYAIFQLDSCELASEIVHYLQGEANRITAECSDLTTDKKTGKVTIKPAGKRTTTVVIQLATTTTQRTKQEQREYEEAIIAERKRVHNVNVARERKARLQQKWAERQWTDSFVALPGQTAAVAKVSTGPSFKDLLAGLASKPAPVIVAPAECPVGWHEGVIYDVVSVQDQLTRFNGFVEPEPEPMITVIENGWEVEYTREQVEAGAAAEAAVAAVPVKAAKPVMLALPGKEGIYSSFFAVARAMKASLKAEAARKSVVPDMSWANSASASA